LLVLGYGVSGDGFQCCRWFEVDGVWLILSLIFGFVQWISMSFGVGFRLFLVGVWLAVGCRVAYGGLRDGSRWWFPFLINSGGFGCVFFFFFLTLLQTHNIKYLLDHFPRMQTNTGKTIIFPKIIYIYKHFTVKNNLHRNKPSQNTGKC
jgi:hypothetical protein